MILLAPNERTIFVGYIDKENNLELNSAAIHHTKKFTFGPEDRFVVIRRVPIE